MDSFTFLVLLLLVIIGVLITSAQDSFASVNNMDSVVFNNASAYSCKDNFKFPTAKFIDNSKSVPKFGYDEALSCLSENGIYCFQPFEDCQDNLNYIQNNIDGIQGNLRPITYQRKGLIDCSYRDIKQNDERTELCIDDSRGNAPKYSFQKSKMLSSL